MSRCTGHCCKRFFLPCSPKELWEKYEDWIRFGGKLAEFFREGTIMPPEPRQAITWAEDVWLIAPMVRLVQVLEPGDTNPINPSDPPSEYKGYSCVHLQENGDCGIYEHRPGLCRRYPYGQPCVYEECTYRPHPNEEVAQLLRLDPEELDT